MALISVVFGASDGTIDIVTTGGGGPSNSDQYSYEWTLGVDSFTVSPPSTPTNLQGLEPGIYEVIVTDAVGCTYSETYEITEPPALTLSGVISDYNGFGVSASGANDGSIAITVGGGTTNYSYAWSTSDGVVPSGQETNQNLTDLVAGTYTVVITDSNDCTITEDYIVTEPGLFTIEEVLESHVDVLCYDDSTGALEVAITGGATPYTYVLTGPVEETQGPTPNITYTKTGLPTGDYTVTVTDANGTVVDIEITILQPAAAIDITLTPSVYGEFSISCFGAGDGSIDVVITGGGGPENDAVYTYDWKKDSIDLSLNTASTDTSLQELGPGNYELTVTDEEGCQAVATITITEPPALTLSGVISDYNGFGVSASGANDGSIAITVGGGTTNYSYAWSTSDGVVPSGQETNQNLTDLVAGTYTVVITDSNDCTITEDYIVTEPGLFTIEEVLESHVDVLCYDDSTGALEVAITGGATPYTYVLTGPVEETQGPTPNITYTKTGLPTGDYTVTVTDANGTVVDIEITILQPAAAIDITLTPSVYGEFSISCFGAGDGSIDVVITGGGGPENDAVYTYDWKKDSIDLSLNTASTDTSLQELGPGNYELTVTDEEGCQAVATITITEPPALTLSGVISDYNGFGVSASGANDGSIAITVGGGTTNYSYAWSTSDGVVPSGQETNQNLTDLVAGTYTVVITDSNDCTITEDYIVTEPGLFTIEEVLESHVDVLCYDDSTGALEVAITGGATPYTYVLTGPVEETQGPTPNITYTKTGLPTGDYTVTVTDANGTVVDIEITILQPAAAIDITLTPSVYGEFSISCFGAGDGSIDVVVTGGGGPENDAVYTYDWKKDSIDLSLNTASTDTSLQELGPGNYELTVTDEEGCQAVATITITEPPALTLSGIVSNTNQYAGFGVSASGANDGFIDITVGGGTTNYTYAWSTSDGVVPSGQETNQNLTDLVAGTYTVVITDSNDCTITEDYIVTEPEELLIVEITTSHVDVLCYDDSTGALEVAITGGATPYTYVLTGPVEETQGPTPNMTYTKTGLPTGDYTVTVTDANGTVVDIEITILQPDLAINIEETISEYNGFNISCFGASDGTIDIVTTGGGGPSNSDQYSYEWTLEGTPFTVSSPSTDTSLQDLGPGIYEVTVTDAVGCTYTENYEITEPPALALSGIVSNTNQYAGFGVSAFGADDGFIDITVGGGTTNYSYAWSTSDGVVPSGQETNQNLTDLVAGTYTVVITDSNDCTITEDYIVTEPEELLIVEITTSHVDVLCYDDSTGALEVAITGGATPYTYVLTGPVEETQGPTPNMTYTKTGLPTGDYTVTVTDANGTVVDIEITILQPDLAINIEETISEYNGFNISCFGAGDGTIDIVTTGGGGPSNSDQYSYEWTLEGTPFTVSSPSTDTSLQDLGPGIYEVTVTDAVGCTYTETYEITEPTGLMLSGVISDYNGFGVSCFGQNDGFIATTISGGTNNFNFTWIASDGGIVPAGQENNQNLTDLVAGTYTVTVADTNDCPIAETFIISEPDEFLINEVASSHVDILCFGDNSGEFEVSIVETVGPYEYLLVGTNYLGDLINQTLITPDLNITYDELFAGIYDVFVTDQNGCSSELLGVVILQPDQGIDITETISEFNGFNISCFGASDGTIDIVTTGGGGPSNSDQYTYEWTLDGTPFAVSSPSTDTSLQELGPGFYQVTVTDVVGCTYTEIYEITEPEDIFIVVDSEVDILCNGDLTGSISITPQGGTGDYEYYWTLDGQQFDDIEDIENLGPGEYVVLIEDSNGCFESEVFQITQPEAIIITVESTVDILCHGDFTGSIDVSIAGGTPDYEITWFGPDTYESTEEDPTNLEAGVYTIQVIDQNNCLQTIEVELTQPDDLLINYNVTNETCTNANDGSISLDIQGGVLDYEISWSNFANGPIQNNLAPGLYSVTVTDGNNCVEEVTIEIEAAPIFDIDPEVNSISCFGDNNGNIQLNIEGGVSPVFVLWDDDPTAGEDRFNLGPGIYSVIISDSSDFNCTIEREFVIVEPAELNSSGVITNALDCDVVSSGSIDLQVVGGTAPYTFEWSNGATTEDLVDIPPGNYAVIITDVNSCKIIDEFIVTRPDEITADLLISFDADCENHTPFQISTIEISGGVSPYEITWSSGVVSGTDGQTMTTSQEGTVIVDIVDALGCDFQTIFEVNLEELGYPDFSYDSFTSNNCNIFSVDDPIQFTNLASGDYISVDWNFGDGFISSEENPTHTYTIPGTYYITQTVNYPYGCSYDIIKEIVITKGYEIILPNAFTPNDDTINDTIRPVFNCMEFVQMSIYDTWGALIYSESSDGDIYGWDGTIKGKPAENGNYILVVKAESWNGKVIDINGPITLIK
jgi:gliding motility-associated-like protein